MRQITFHCSGKQIFDAVIQAAKNLDLEVNEKSVADNYIALEHAGSLLSYGNKIDVKIKTSEGNKHIVPVSSRSTAAVQLIDWGTNERLESNIIDEIKDILGQ